MEFSLPKNIIAIISILNQSGFKAHAVGGCVRDMALGTTPKDWDITTNATPDKVKGLFAKTYDTGLKHGTVTVSYEGMTAEVTTWRREALYSDHRRPDHVDFSHSLVEDLERRDFTMNAMAYHPEEGLIDPYQGLDDIGRKTIRCVGDPLKRFSEDALRMLRAVRFACQLGFCIEPATLSAIHSLSGDLAYVSRERIQAELNKILESQQPQKLSLLWETGLSREIFPTIHLFPGDFSQLSLKMTLPGDKKSLLLALLFYLAFRANPAPHAEELLKRLKYDNDTLTYVKNLLTGMKELEVLSKRNYRKLAYEKGTELARSAFRLRGLIKGTGISEIEPFMNMEPIIPVISGEALLKTGCFRGKEIGQTLKCLSLCLYEKPELNDYDTLMLLGKVMLEKIDS